MTSTSQPQFQQLRLKLETISFMIHNCLLNVTILICGVGSVHNRAMHISILVCGSQQGGP